MVNFRVSHTPKVQTGRKSERCRRSVRMLNNCSVKQILLMSLYENNKKASTMREIVVEAFYYRNTQALYPSPRMVCMVKSSLCSNRFRRRPICTLTVADVESDSGPQISSMSCSLVKIWFG